MEITKLILEKISNLERLLADQSILQKETLSFKEAVRHLDISPSHLYKMTSSRMIPHYCPSGKKLYFKRSELDLWMQNNKKESSKQIEAKAAEYVIKNTKI